MGLEILLYDRSPAQEKRYQQLSSKYCETYAENPGPALTEEEQAEYTSLKQENLQFPSHKHPEHYSNRRYLRSSYNDGSFNRVMENLGLPGFYEVLDYNQQEENEDGYWRPSKTKLTQVLEAAQKLVADLAALPHALRVQSVAATDLSGGKKAQDGAGAIAITMKHLVRSGDCQSFNWYGNFEGDFYLGTEQLPVVGAIPGVDVLNRSCVHLVYKADLTSYKQTADVLVEFIEEALSLEHPIISWLA